MQESWREGEEEGGGEEGRWEEEVGRGHVGGRKGGREERGDDGVFA